MGAWGKGAMTAAIPGVAVVLSVLTLGPDETWLRLKWLWAGHPRPIVVSVESEADRPNGTFIATLRNPSWKAVAITGYNTSAAVAMAAVEDIGDDGGVTVMATKEPDPHDCSQDRKVAFARPLKIEPDGIRGLQIRPYDTVCPFEVHFTSDHGPTQSHPVWALDLEKQKGLGARAPTKTCSDGSVRLATEHC